MIAMKQVQIYGCDLEVEIDERKIEPYTLLDYGTVICDYKESYVLDDGRRIVYDESINDWVMLG